MTLLCLIASPILLFQFKWEPTNSSPRSPSTFQGANLGISFSIWSRNTGWMIVSLVYFHGIFSLVIFGVFFLVLMSRLKSFFFEKYVGFKHANHNMLRLNTSKYAIELINDSRKPNSNSTWHFPSVSGRGLWSWRYLPHTWSRSLHQASPSAHLRFIELVYVSLLSSNHLQLFVLLSLMPSAHLSCCV